MTTPPPDLAILHYGDGEYVVMKPGRYVRCAVTERPIPLEALRYWSTTLQEAYFSPIEFIARVLNASVSAQK